MTIAEEIDDAARAAGWLSSPTRGLTKQFRKTVETKVPGEAWRFVLSVTLFNSGNLDGALLEGNKPAGPTKTAELVTLNQILDALTGPLWKVLS